MTKHLKANDALYELLNDLYWSTDYDPSLTEIYTMLTNMAEDGDAEAVKELRRWDRAIQMDCAVCREHVTRKKKG